MFGAVRLVPFIYTDAVLFVDSSTSLFFCMDAFAHVSMSICFPEKERKKHKHACARAHVCLQDVHSCKRNVLG